MIKSLTKPKAFAALEAIYETVIGDLRSSGLDTPAIEQGMIHIKAPFFHNDYKVTIKNTMPDVEKTA
jgi:hypothetical protein